MSIYRPTREDYLMNDRRGSLYKHYDKKAIIHHVTTMIATTKNVRFAGNNHLLTNGGADGLTRAIIKVSGHQHRWLAGGYNPEIGHL